MTIQSTTLFILFGLMSLFIADQAWDLKIALDDAAFKQCISTMFETNVKECVR